MITVETATINDGAYLYGLEHRRHLRDNEHGELHEYISVYLYTDAQIKTLKNKLPNVNKN